MIGSKATKLPEATPKKSTQEYNSVINVYGTVQLGIPFIALRSSLTDFVGSLIQSPNNIDQYWIYV